MLKFQFKTSLKFSFLKIFKIYDQKLDQIHVIKEKVRVYMIGLGQVFQIPNYCRTIKFINNQTNKT